MTFVEQITIVGLPLCTRANSRGVAESVKILRAEGITDRLRGSAKSFHDIGDATLAEIRSDSGHKNLANFPQFLQATERIRSAVKKWDREGLLFGLGGECSICVGTLAELENRLAGSVGMVWIDAHGDFNTPETTPSGYIGGMCLALACGRGPELDGIVENGKEILSEGNVVHVASRALDPLESENMISCPMKIISAQAIHKEGITSTVNSAISSLANRCDWIACHLDVDSIDPELTPAVNFPEPGGLTVDEAKSIVSAVNQTRKMKLFELAGYNASLDPSRASALKLVNTIAEIFT